MTIKSHVSSYRHDDPAAQSPALRRAAPAFMVLVFSFCAAAHAQEGDSAQEGGKTTTMERLETIIVTAERLGRSLMDTATSVVVIDEATLQQRPLIEGTNELFDRIPNITSSGTTDFAPTVRGIDGTGPGHASNAFLAGARARLNLQLDGRPANFWEIVYGDAGVWDVQQVEVLRGPQSALQGRNAIAGTLSMKTNDPTYDTQAKFRVLGGNLRTRQYSGAVSAPLVGDQFAFRLAADHRTSESFARFTGYPSWSGHPGVDNPGEYETSNYRGKLLIEPKALEGFSALVTLNYSKSRAPQGEDVEEPFNDEFTSSFPTQAVFIPKTSSGIVDLTWRRSDNLAFETLLTLTDTDITRLGAPGLGYATIEGREFVAEPRVRFTSGALSGLAGIYYFRGEQHDFLDFIALGNWDDDTRTTAVFGEATYEFSERFDVTLGARYEEEHRRRLGGLLIFETDLDETTEVFLPKLVLSWHPTEQLTIGTLAARGYNGGSAGLTFFPTILTYAFDPEYVWNYEAFLRASLADGRLALTGNLFYSDYEDMQLPSVVVDGFPSITINAEEAVTYGAEFSAIWQALPGLQLSAGVGLLETDIKKFSGTGFEGNELPQAPSITADVGAVFRQGGFEFSVDARYSDSYFSDIENARIRQTDVYWVANGQIAYDFGNVRVFGAVDNVFDSHDRIYRFPPLLNIDGSLVPASANILRPRTYSIGVQVEL